MRTTLVPARVKSLVVAVVAVVSGFGATAAHAAGTIADPDLYTTTDFSGTGAQVGTVHTGAMRSAAATGAAEAGRDPRILVIGTGVQRSLFPADLQQSIELPSAADGIDTHGHGTLAASAIFQMLPSATVTSLKVPSYTNTWDLLYVDKLAAALEHARANRARYDAVLLAYPPQGALDPVSHSIGWVRYPGFGTGMSMVVEALLTARSPTQGPVTGIPIDKTLRDRIFARSNLKQRDAVERYVAQALAWRRAVAAVEALSDAGVGVIAPAGDFTRRAGGAVQPLPTQTVFGLSALPSVITVGAAYADETGAYRLSPTSGRGPTLALDAKPDVLAPSNVMAMLPGKAVLQWPDDSARAPVQPLDWAKPGVPPTPCPSLTGEYRCVLQGSSVVSAAVVAANVAGLVSSGTPNPASARAAGDDEILRGIAWSQASQTPSSASEPRPSYPWEEGAGVFTGLGSFDLGATPVALAPASLGEVQWGRPKSKTIPLWSGAGDAASVTAAIDSFLGPDATGAALALPYADPARVTAVNEGGRPTVTASGDRYQGGVYAGRLRIASPSGETVRIPVSLVQDVAVDFHVDYAYNELQTGGAEGERVEGISAVLFAGLPSNVGLIGEAFKNFTTSAFKAVGGDPTNSVVIRLGTTRNTFVDTSLPAREHGRGRIDAVPPGFYKFQILSDHGVTGMQARGQWESLGIGFATSGPEAAYTPGANLLVPAQPPCPDGAAKGPVSPSCTERDPRIGEVDPDTGFCVVRNPSTQVSFNVYCAEIAFAVPTAVVSRAVHLIEHDADPARSEWRVCGVDMPLDGKPVDFAALVNEAKECDGPTAPTAWSIQPKAPGCLGDTERARYPGGHPADVSLTYSGGPAALPGRNLPVAVLTYQFPLPRPNTLATGSLSLSYEAENAVIGTRFKTGSDANGDYSNNLVAIQDPRLALKPALDTSSKRGSVYTQWEVMSAGAAVGEVSIVVLPTRWTREDMDPTKPVSTVQLCDVALRMWTYAKTSWGKAAVEGGVPTQFLPMLDSGAAARIDPSKQRVRARYDAGSGTFRDLGPEPESFDFVTQIPKNTTKNSAAAHAVRSPVGGPAYLKGARRWAANARGEQVLPAGYKTYDTGGGVTPLSCYEGSAGSTDPQRRFESETCTLWNQARSSGQLLADLTPLASKNSRFAGALALDHATVRRAGGAVAYETADADDEGAFDAAGHWVRRDGSYVREIPVSDFYEAPFTDLLTQLLSGWLTVTKDPQTSLRMLTVNTGTADGTQRAVSALLG